jgi:hypothetical protein
MRMIWPDRIGTHPRIIKENGEKIELCYSNTPVLHYLLNKIGGRVGRRRRHDIVGSRQSSSVEQVTRPGDWDSRLIRPW